MTTLFAYILGAMFPVMVIITFTTGIGKTDLKAEFKQRYKTILIVGVVFWTIAVWALAKIGIFEYHSGDIAPRFLIGLALPVAIGLMLFKSVTFIKVLDNTPHSLIVGSQILRILGVSFLYMAQDGVGPLEFASAGYGDIVTGTLASLGTILLVLDISGSKWLVWLANIAGMFDLLNVSRILLTYYPTWYENEPSTGIAGEFPTVLILCLAAPIALLLHVYSIRALIRK